MKNEETQDFIRETAGTKLQGLLTEALELDDGQFAFIFLCSESGSCTFSDRERSILSLNKMWGEEQMLMVNELYDGMKTKMSLLLFLHYTNASSIQRASLWLKACLLQWAIWSFQFNDCYTTYKIRCRGRACDEMTCEPDGSNHWLFHHGVPSV